MRRVWLPPARKRKNEMEDEENMHSYVDGRAGFCSVSLWKQRGCGGSCDDRRSKSVGGKLADLKAAASGSVAGRRSAGHVEQSVSATAMLARRGIVIRSRMSAVHGWAIQAASPPAVPNPRPSR